MLKISFKSLIACILLLSPVAHAGTIQYTTSGSATINPSGSFDSDPVPIAGTLVMHDDISEVITVADGWEDYIEEPPGHTATFLGFYFNIGDQYTFLGTDASVYYASGWDYFADFSGAGDFSEWHIHRGEYAVGEFYTGPDYDAGVHTFAFPDTFTLYSGDSFWDSGFTGEGDLSYVSMTFTRGAPVPEPATIILFGTGLIGIARAARKKYKH